MAEKKTKRREISAARLYKYLIKYVDENGLDETDSIGIVLDQLRATIVQEATTD